MNSRLKTLDKKIRRCTCGAWIYDQQYCSYPHAHNLRNNDRTDELT